uniref:EamA domain-containing protein n=1 Tax=Attheya septentrionalis TaxID=420275 RepID=A0A7S2USB4_9STRA|mmetsp:Transcript_7921/g.14278  ORF Transcript_7921/g.14278 Transcript_7921/m.14278 type:complete len:467 (+) Transcript_7921:362-1762(+)|eukprot:CAMPEP_0198288504 /NCGR_PEP_ID=MMETSP1449-20131203/6966_1 /TAXON_ID=420275 /ORGANISM="Attheya septentrionalis, Strain CCMP2084" /LENGTH=466 /DNA_ID=CAMNT_0043986653 /DNA_START=340 /DNA_END=1740 /DNA_ORIENTATION=+
MTAATEDQARYGTIETEATDQHRPLPPAGRRRSSMFQQLTEAVDANTRQLPRVQQEGDGPATGVLASRRRSSTMYQLKEAIHDELDEIENHADTFILEMNITRSLSILPEDVIKAVQAMSAQFDDDIEDEEDAAFGPTELQKLSGGKLREKVPISAYFLLASAVFSLSAIGPLFKMQDGVEPTMKIFWRMTGTSLMLLPLAFHSVYKEGIPRLDWTQCATIVMSAAFYATMTTSFVIALQFTSVGNTVIFGNTQSILLLLGKTFAGHHVMPMELIGAIIAFSGAVLCSRDSVSESSATGNDMTIYGDLIAILSAFGGVWYLVFAKTVRPFVSIYVFMFSMMSISAMLILGFMQLTNMEFTFDRHVNHGLFGWMNLQANRLPLELLMVFICDLFGAMGYVRSMHYFDTLVITVAALMEPIAAMLQAFLFGVGFLPGTMGWIGNAMVAAGTFAVVLPSASKGGPSAGH